MGFVFLDEFEKHKTGCQSIEEVGLRHKARAFFNNDLDWNRHTELDDVRAKITPQRIDEEPSSAGKKALRFLAGLHPEPTFRGWIYTDTRGPTLTPYWDKDQRAAIALAYKRALDVVETSINVLTIGDLIADSNDLFIEWFGDSGNVAGDKLAMAAQFKLLRSALSNIRVVSDDVADRDCVASAAGWEGLNVIYVGDDFWAPPNMSAEDVKRGVELKQAQACIHEWTHKYFNPKTKDVKHAGSTAYGDAACRALAQADPAKAQNNADTVGYFAIDAWWRKYRASPFSGGAKWGKNQQAKGSPKFDLI